MPGRQPPHLALRSPGAGRDRDVPVPEVERLPRPGDHIGLHTAHHRQRRSGRGRLALAKGAPTRTSYRPNGCQKPDSSMPPAALHPFHEQGRPLADPDAHGGQATAAVGAFEPPHQGDQEPGSGAAQRVTEGDGAAVGVHDVRVEAEVADACDRLGGERLVELDGVEVVDGPAAAARGPCGWPAPARSP